MSLPDPTGQKPPEWGTLDYATWGLNTTIWGAGKVVQYGILKPLEIFGNVASVLDENLFGGGVESDSSKTLEDKEILHTPESRKIPPEKALKAMQGEKFETDAKVMELQDEVNMLKQQLREFRKQNLRALQGTDPDSSSNEVINSPKATITNSVNDKIDKDKPEITGESARPRGDGIQFNKIESEEEELIVDNSTNTTKSSQGVSDTVVEEFFSPLYDGEDQADIIHSLKKTLEEQKPTVDLDTLLDDPPPVPLAKPGTRGKPSRGGPSNMGNRVPGQGQSIIPQDQNIFNVRDENLKRRLGINDATLQERRDAFKIVYKELNSFIKSTNSEIKDIKNKKNIESIGKANSFEINRKEDFLKLENMRTDLLKAKTTLASFSKLIQDFQNLEKTNPEAASKQRVKFSYEPGKGEIKIVYQSMQQVIDKELIKGYEEDIKKIEYSIKNLIISMNTTKKMFAGKLYQEELKYTSKIGESVEHKKITVANVLNLEKNIRVADAKLKKITANMKTYLVETIKEQAEDVVEELTPDQKELEEKIQKERQEKMQKEIDEKINALKPSNVSQYSFELIDQTEVL
ncbi:MAG TPA: hypothetical protein VGP47_02445 [Parachlamydiaceae bacterium]|nr:hypothetical protein [Nitrosopumilus sp.]HEV8051326.1 hypothetical protein [Parachlamydiaceae bacterium]